MKWKYQYQYVCEHQYRDTPHGPSCDQVWVMKHVYAPVITDKTTKEQRSSY